jgi:hypothetical protein
MAALLRRHGMSAPKDRWHQLADAVLDSNLPVSDKSVFRFLLDKADYGTAELPARYTPTRKTIARKTSLSFSQAGYSTRHLQRHGWLVVEGRAGPGHPLNYTLAVGAGCDCTGRVHTAVTPACRLKTTPQVVLAAAMVATVTAAASAPATASTVPTEHANGANHWHRTVPTNGANAAGQVINPTERQREGRVLKGTVREKSASPAVPPDWLLIKQLIRIVHDDPCGGIHRSELAERLQVSPSSPVLRTALAVAYRTKKIDYCGRYVVKPIPKNKWPKEMPPVSPVLAGPCGYPSCVRDGYQHRNGVWCEAHAEKMEIGR